VAEVFDDCLRAVHVLRDKHCILAVHRVKGRVGGLRVRKEDSFFGGEGRTERSKMRIVEASFSGRDLKNLMKPSSFSWSRGREGVSARGS
jgi:hypothetical protein